MSEGVRDIRDRSVGGYFGVNGLHTEGTRETKT